MKITITEPHPETYFKSLSPGDIFQMIIGGVYFVLLRKNPMVNVSDLTAPKGKYIYMGLKDNTLYTCDYDELPIIYKGEMHFNSEEEYPL